jgi:hypothetical protein
VGHRSKLTYTVGWLEGGAGASWLPGDLRPALAGDGPARPSGELGEAATERGYNCYQRGAGSGGEQGYGGQAHYDRGRAGGTPPRDGEEGRQRRDMAA